MSKSSKCRAAKGSLPEHAIPKLFEVHGGGASAANGVYEYAGMVNKRPYYEKVAADGETNPGPVIWYFQTSAPPGSWFVGWYISKRLGTSSMSAADDYYSAYVHGLLPPTDGWVTRGTALGPLGGSGIEPPPSLSCPAVAETEAPSCAALEACGKDEVKAGPEEEAATAGGGGAEALAAKGRACTGRLPWKLMVSGAGSPECNGVYVLAGEEAHRPCYRKEGGGGGPAVWYFHDCVVEKGTAGLSSYRGWYISRDVGTSALSAAADYYTCYSHHGLAPPADGWQARLPGSGPAAGCGALPAPRVTVYDEHAEQQQQQQYGMLVRIQLPEGATISVVSSLSHETVEGLKLRVQALTAMPIYHQALSLRGTRLDDDSAQLSSLPLGLGDLLMLSTTASPPPALVQPGLSCVAVVGGGPVGLWAAVQLKAYLGMQARVVVVEAREAYSRTHALSISESAFDGIVPWVPGRAAAAELEMLRKKWVPRTRTSIVESDLRAVAEAAGVELRYGKAVTDLQALSSSMEEEEGTRPSVIVCCDGARSSGRAQLLAQEASEFSRERQLGSLIQIKFESPGEAHVGRGGLSRFLQNLPARQQFFNVLAGNYDHDKGVTPMTAFALVNDDIAASLHGSGCTSNRPLSSFTDLEQASHDPTLAHDVAAVLHQACPGGITPGSLRISVLPVSYQVAARVCGRVGGTPVVLAGDAAMGLPLEKGLNKGWAISSALCGFLVHCPSIEQALRAYQVHFDSASERAVASVERDYAGYKATIATANVARTIVQAVVMPGRSLVGKSKSPTAPTKAQITAKDG